MNLNLLSITFNILTLTSEILFITRSCNCSYQHVNLFNEFIDKFDKLDNDCWTCMFNVECIIKPTRSTKVSASVVGGMFAIATMSC